MDILPVSRKEQFDIIVFCHLRWDFVWQRPQHLMRRLSKRHRVLFIEEPVNKTSKSSPLRQVSSSLWVLQPQAAAVSAPAYSREVQGAIKKFQIHKPVVWMYSPAFINQLDTIDYCLVVYDCMDELSAFKGASKALRNQEISLLNLAQLVFTGGKSLYRSKLKQHESVYCFPSSIEQKHFQKTINRKFTPPPDMKHIPHPIVGYYGVLDERLDTTLLLTAASRLPKTNFVMVGPLAKINESDLPHLPNIHYLGMKTYDELPDYLHSFDIAFMPFALNESTKYISPTKTLEFMAAHKPIISTPITDVVNDYSHVVKITSSTSDMVKAIQMFLSESTYQRKQRILQESRILAKSSWDKTAQSMEKLIDEAVSRLQKTTIPQKNYHIRLRWLETS